MITYHNPILLELNFPRSSGVSISGFEQLLSFVPLESAFDLEGGNQPYKIQLQVLVLCREDATLSYISPKLVPVSEMTS